MKNRSIQKLYGFKKGKIWRVNFFPGVSKLFKVYFFKLLYSYKIKLNYIYFFHHKWKEY